MPVSTIVLPCFLNEMRESLAHSHVKQLFSITNRSRFEFFGAPPIQIPS